MQPHGPPQLRLGGFESATHRRFDGARVDALEPSGHPRSAVLDVALLRSLGIRTIREAFRWHLVERGSGVFDWSSARGQIEGALASDAEIIWDICHWGVPDGLDVMAPEWPGRLARFLLGQGDALKQQFLLAHLAVVEALRAEGVAPRIIVSEPRIWIVPEVGDAPEILSARQRMAGSLSAVDAILTRDPSAIDIIGLNYYPHNQWWADDVRVLRGEPDYRPLRELLLDMARRYAMPLALTETGAEEPDGPAWNDYVTGEVRAARTGGSDIQGVCIYPIQDYAGWDNGRHCKCGPLGIRQGQKTLRATHHQSIACTQGAGGQPGGG